jgi:uncharacterized protein Yka (UPF0111/DUF47 family)
MQKIEAVASIGKDSLLLPARIKAALSANDRVKLYLSVLQAAAAHADHADVEPLDLSHEMAVVGERSAWLRGLAATASHVDGVLQVPNLQQLVKRLSDDLDVMTRPLVESGTKGDPLHERLEHWRGWLAALSGEKISHEQMQMLMRGQRSHGADSLHLFVMELHKRINHLATTLSSEEIDGAHVWQLREQDHARVSAFMRGLNRTARLKFDHCGLDTAATCDGERLLIQNDIGTNDAHVLVLQIEGSTITLSYSDLHRSRFEFFQTLLAPFGANWSGVQPKVNAQLNDGKAFTFGTACFECTDDESVNSVLEGIGSRIVFLIDWNRARKRLLPFVENHVAVDVLAEAARIDVGHMAWLKAGGDQLIYAAMQSGGRGDFRIGDRLDEVLDAADVCGFLVDVLRLAAEALLKGQPTALVADETRMLLARRVRQHGSELELLGEHAAYCHALAQAVSDGLARNSITQDGGDGAKARAIAADALATRAKGWERQADHLVMRARDHAQRQPRWAPFAHLLELSDDVADALEEAAFLMSLIAAGHQQGWTTEVKHALSRLARTVLVATQEHIKAIAIARSLDAGSATVDGDAFLAALWSVLQSERQCDELLRAARRTLLGAISDAPALMLANDLAVSLELASDRLLIAAYALRDVAFDEAEAIS